MLNYTKYNNVFKGPTHLGRPELVRSHTQCKAQNNYAKSRGEASDF